MKRSALLLLLSLPLLLSAKVSVTNLRVENLSEPLGIGTAEPRFSWQTVADHEHDVVQTAYELVVSSDKGEVWRTGRVESDEQLWVPYRGTPLKSGQHLTWRLKVYTNRGETAWSEPQRFSIGLLTESRWGGRWIGLESLQPGEQMATAYSRLAARYLRKVFALSGKPVRRATAYVCGLGFYRLFVNGVEVGADDYLKPAPADYRKTIYYNTYDVTAQMADSFAVGIVLGNGKYFAPRQNKPYKNVTFGFPKCRMNLIVEYADGTTQRLVTDDTWRVTARGPIRANNEYDGEEYDARMELDGWLRTDYDDSRWLKAERTALPQGELKASGMNGERAVEVALSSVQGNIFDFGQNMAGWVAFVPHGKAGDTIRVRYAERLNADGTLYTANLRHARSTDVYVCNGHETAAWHPSFVYHGFRYVEISGAPVSEVKAYAVSDAMASTGHFECSDTTLNRVVRNAWWGVLSNYKGMPVDCPQRDERQPWLGDRTAGTLGESFLFDNERLYTKWKRDICDAQRSDGVIPDVAPAFWNYFTDDVTWPAALPFTCDMLYRQYGNLQPIRDCYPSMKRWVMHMQEDNMRGDLITKDKYGDWCMPPERLELVHSQDPARQTDGTLIATAYMIRCLQLMEQFARLQDLSDDAVYWHKRCEIMTDAFNRRFLHVAQGTSPVPGHPLYPDSTYYDNNTATANLLPLAFGIVPDSVRQQVAGNVVRKLYENKWRLTTGVIGTSWLLRTLADNGYPDVAYMVATQRAYPSWGYMVEQGATTIWELWNGDKAAPTMNSGNHVMLLGDLLPWCFQHLGGIQSVGDGFSVAYKHLVLRPDFSIQNCSYVNASYETPYGLVESRWNKTLQQLHWEVTIPCNTTADVCLPDGTVRCVGSGRHTFDVAIPTRDARILKDEFLYDQAPFLSPHASTIVETKKGDLVCAYFAGTYERNPDCCIWVSTKKRGSNEWQAPVLAADGVFSDTLRKACWNPVLTEMPDGELWLFYKIGVNVQDWTGWLVKSRDGGKTWSEREPLPEGFLGPVKNKPLLLGDRLICGSSTEKGGWKFHVELYNLKTRQWRYVGPVEANLAIPTKEPDKLKPIGCIQPSILQLKDGRLMVLMRSQNGRLARSYSSDQGETWSKVELSDLPSNQSGTDAVTLSDGRQVLVYNDFATLMGEPKGPRTPLCVAVSGDDGLTWQRILTLEDSPISEYSYPAVIEGRDGTLHITYTWRRKGVAYKQIRL